MATVVVNVDVNKMICLHQHKINIGSSKMWYSTIKKSLLVAFIMASVGYAGLSSAHGGGATMDPEGISPTFTGLAQITCSSTGSEPTDHLLARIRDNSAPVHGLLVNLQLYKGSKAVNITDTVSGDANFSPFISLQGGNGVYYLMINKTDAGARAFDLEWHCTAASGTHTDTDISVLQFQ